MPENAQCIQTHVTGRNRKHIAQVVSQVTKPFQDRIAALDTQLKAARNTIALCMTGSLPRGGGGPSDGSKDQQLAKLQALVAVKEKEVADLRTQLEASQYSVNEYWEASNKLEEAATEAEYRFQGLQETIDALAKANQAATSASGNPCLRSTLPGLPLVWLHFLRMPQWLRRVAAGQLGWKSLPKP